MEVLLKKNRELILKYQRNEENANVKKVKAYCESFFDYTTEEGVQEINEFLIKRINNIKDANSNGKKKRN